MTPKGGLPGPEVPAKGRTQTHLPPERWVMLLSLSRVLGFSLPGPHRALNSDQLLTFWMRAIRANGPSVHADWWSWGTTGPHLRARAVRSTSTAFVSNNNDLRYFRDVDRMNAWVVLVHEILSRAGGPPPPLELTAEASRLLLGDQVRVDLGV